MRPELRCLAVRQSDSEWFDGPVGYVLRNPRSLPFVKQRGQLGFFRPSRSVLDVVRRRSREEWRNRPE